ncbi:Tyrosine kinase receptor Cad96Ca [Halotydeus destructor]|nr:Tyrosine kinase receptor Cad96Ca [Halotydeus destructor]
MGHHHHHLERLMAMVFLVSASNIFTVCQAQRGFASSFSDFPNTPPVFAIPNRWPIREDQAIGSRVMTLRTIDDEKDKMVYGIAKSEAPAEYSATHMFTVNPRTGDVFLKENLRGKAGHQFYTYMTAHDGHNSAKFEVCFEILPSEEHYDEESPVGAPVEIASSNSTDRSKPSFIARPFPAGRPPHSFPAFNPVAIRPKVPKVPFAATAAPARPTSSAAPGAKSSVLPEASDTPTTSATAPGRPVPVYSPTERPDPVLVATNTSFEHDGGSNGLGGNLHGGGRAGSGHTRKPADWHGYRLDLITAFLPLLAAIAFAPIVGIVFYVLHRKCSRHPNPAMIKGLSHKIPANKTPSMETTMTSTSTASTFDYNGDFFNQIGRTVRSTVSNRYESNQDIEGSPFVKMDDTQWEFPRHHLHFKDILGEGCFGQVWRCEARGLGSPDTPQIVAVKTLKENASDKDKKEFISELEIMKLLDPHPNVVTLLGCCSEKDPVFLIMEFVPYGKLQSYLRDSRTGHNEILTARDLTSFAYQVAKGMEYISSKGIIHRDLAARNVLVGANKQCKIADFGFARDIIASHVYERKSEGRLPIRWMAPESLYDNLFTTKSDVWSFGILMWEIVTMASTPYPGLVAAEVMKRVRDGLRLEKPEHCKREMYNVMFYCWMTDPNERPAFDDIVQMLDKLLVSENDYLELARFPDHAYYNIITNLSGEKL